MASAKNLQRFFSEKAGGQQGRRVGVVNSKEADTSTPLPMLLSMTTHLVTPPFAQPICRGGQPYGAGLTYTVPAVEYLGFQL